MSGASRHLSAEWITGPEGFAALGGAWDELLADSRADGVFLCRDWLEAWWRAFGAGRRPRILVVREEPGGRLLAAAPLCEGTGRVLGLLPVRQWSFIGAGVAAPDHLDVIVRRGHEASAGAALVDALLAAADQWRLLRLEGLAPDSLAAALLAGRPGVGILRLSTNTCRFLRLPATWEDWLAALPAKRRGRQGWRRRRLEAERPGEVRFRTVTAPAELESAMASLFALHQDVQTARGNPGSFADPRMRALHLDAAARFLAAGRLRLHLISVGDADIAAIHCLRWGERVSFYAIGFAAGWARHNPGRQVMAFSLQEAIGEGAAEYDFLRGDEGYKEAFATESRSEDNLLVAVTPLGRLMLALESRYRALRRRLRPLKRALARRLRPAATRESEESGMAGRAG